MGYFVIFLAGVLVIGVLAWLRNRGIGGIPNPMAGWNIPNVNALPREQWTLFIAPLLTLVVVFLVIPELFPGFTARYLKNDGPVWMLLFVLGLLALAAVIPHSFLPVRLVAFGVLGIAFLLSVGPPALDSLPSLQSKPATETTRVPAAPERRVARVPDDPC